MSDLNRAKELLKSGDYTCVLIKGEAVFTSDMRGVKPLVRWYESDVDFTDFSAADKVVGKGASFLYVLLGAREVYADVMSKSALATLKAYGISAEYEVLADNIINRRGDGICPFEEAVLKISDKAEAFSAIKAKMQELGITL